MKYYLDGSGLFYSCGALLKLSKKPIEVSRYIIYDSIEPLRIAKLAKRIQIMKDGQILEAQLQNGKRVFFYYEEGFFCKMKVAPIEILEGEDELLKHLGLLGKKGILHYPEDSIL